MNRRQVFASLPFAAASAATAPAAHPSRPRFRSPFEEVIDPVFADIPKTGSPGFAVSIVREGAVLFARGYGLSNLDEATPITPDTVFHLASLSKQFTGAAVALLVLAGELDLDAPLADYMPEAAKYGPDLRLAHLAYMTSGLHEYTTTARTSGQPWQSFFYFTRDEAISRSLAQPDLMFSPGERWAYSNVNYMILSRIVEQVSGQGFADFVRARIFTPLGMTSSFIDDDTTRIVPSRAVGYGRRSAALTAEAANLGLVVHDGPGFARMSRVSPHFGGSGVFSTLVDLARWERNWRSQIVGGPRFTALMTTPRRFAHDKVDDGLGLVASTFEDRPMIWYSGADLDASTWMGRFPDSDTTVACLSNLSSDSAERRAGSLLAALIHAGLI